MSLDDIVNGVITTGNMAKDIKIAKNGEDVGIAMAKNAALAIAPPAASYLLDNAIAVLDPKVANSVMVLIVNNTVKELRKENLFRDDSYEYQTLRQNLNMDNFAAIKEQFREASNQLKSKHQNNPELQEIHEPVDLTKYQTTHQRTLHEKAFGELPEQTSKQWDEYFKDGKYQEAKTLLNKHAQEITLETSIANAYKDRDNEVLKAIEPVSVKILSLVEKARDLSEEDINTILYTCVEKNIDPKIITQITPRENGSKVMISTIVAGNTFDVDLKPSKSLKDTVNLYKERHPQEIDHINISDVLKKLDEKPEVQDIQGKPLASSLIGPTYEKVSSQLRPKLEEIGLQEKHIDALVSATTLACTKAKLDPDQVGISGEDKIFAVGKNRAHFFVLNAFEEVGKDPKESLQEADKIAQTTQEHERQQTINNSLQRESLSKDMRMV